MAFRFSQYEINSNFLNTELINIIFYLFFSLFKDFLKDFELNENLGDGKLQVGKETEPSSSKRNNEVNQQSQENTPRLQFNRNVENFSSQNSHTFDASTPKSPQNAVPAANTVCRQNSVLDVFKRKEPGKSDENQLNPKRRENSSSQIDPQPFNSAPKSQANGVPEANTVRRQNSVLDVFKQNEPDKSDDNQLKRKRKVAFLETVEQLDNQKKISNSTTNQTSKGFKEPQPIPSTSGVQFTTNRANANKSNNGEIQNTSKSPAKKIAVKISRIKRTMVREFPGPAGLLPEHAKSSDVPTLNLITQEQNERIGNRPDVFSQNTKNQFTSGAWRLMTDDLPADFELCDIATVRENAIEYSKKFTKVPYLAGIVQRIDYRLNDPRILLKDHSGTIEACLHHSICKAHANVLGLNVVILMKNTGVIVTSKKCVILIISEKSLVSMYSDEARLIETPNLEDLLDSNYNCMAHESQISSLGEAEDENGNTN